MGKRDDGRCGADIPASILCHPSFPRLDTAQETIDFHLRARDRGGAAAFFADLRGLIAVILAHGDSDTVGDLPDFVHDCFSTHCGSRDELAAASASASRQPRARLYSRITPTDPVLMAAIAPVAVETLQRAEVDRVRLLLPLAEHARRTDPDRGRGASSRSIVSSGLSEAWAKALRMTSPFFAVRAGGHGRRRSRPDRGYGPEHVPQLLWREVYEDEFADLLPALPMRIGRRACALWLVKLSFPMRADIAGRMLDMPPRMTQGALHRLSVELTVTGREAAFVAAMDAVVARLCDSVPLINYAARRAQFAELTNIDIIDWAEICAAAGVGTGRSAKSRNAATWLWTELTCGDELLAPAIRGRRAGRSTRLADYRAFVERLAPRLADGLLSYGHQLLGAAQ
jgi:hypothetical protein